MKKTLVRTTIVLFGAVCLSVAILFVFLGDPNAYDELDELAQNLSESPSEDALRDLLNYPADGAYSYFKTALVAETFAKNPAIYGTVCKDLKTDGERDSIRQLLSLGDQAFEYHPERKPSGFDQAFPDNRHLLGEEPAR